MMRRDCIVLRAVLWLIAAVLLAGPGGIKTSAAEEPVSIVWTTE